MILLKNVTEFKEKDIAKTTFISTISHELKTPISAIMMSLKLLEDNRIGKLNTEQESLSKNIKENSDRLLEITGELLKMSQVESGKLYLNPKITKPIELIDYAIKRTGYRPSVLTVRSKWSILKRSPNCLSTARKLLGL